MEGGYGRLPAGIFYRFKYPYHGFAFSSVLERIGSAGRIAATGITIRSSWLVSASNGKLSAF